MTSHIDAAIVGLGHAALTVISALSDHQITPTAFAPDADAGRAWRNRYDALRLNTDATSSLVPNQPPTQELLRWPSGQQWADYLASVADRLDYHHEPCEVLAVSRHPDGWAIDTASGRHVACDVVVATGRNRRPFIPPWPGTDDTEIPIVHSSHFQAASDFRNQDVLVVGAGNSGTEIAHLLATEAASVTISVRTRPMFVRRETLGISITQIGRLAKHVPAPILDRGARAMQRIQFGDLSSVGLGPPERNLSHDLANEGGPTVDAGFIDSVKTGDIDVVAEIDHFTDNELVLADNTRLTPDTVIAATGYRTGLETLVPAELLDNDGWPLATKPPYQAEPGLYFAGFAPATLTAFMPDFAEHLPAIAQSIARTTPRRQKHERAEKSLPTGRLP